MRYARAVDANQAAIVDALRKLGALVHSTARLGGGFPDLVVLWRGVVLLVEVKDGRKPPSARKLTPDELAFRDLGWPVHVVESVEQALQLLAAEEDWDVEDYALLGCECAPCQQVNNTAKEPK